MEPVELRCQDQTSPLAVDAGKVRFSWINQSAERGERQTAYQIVVPDSWDSGKVPSDQSLHVPYAGRSLEEGRPYEWKVRVWDKDGKPSEWSPPARFTTAPGAWQAKWVAAQDVPMNRPLGQRYTPAPNMPGVFTNTPSPRREAVMMRREVTFPSKPVRALAHVAGLGFVKLRVNGQPAGDRVMSPPLTDYTKRAYYDTYDITTLLRPETNAIGLLIGNGYFSAPSRGWGKWYGVGNEPVASVEVEVIFADGSRKVIVTDGSWRWATGAITFNNFFVGETQDLRLAQAGWDEGGFDARHWQPVALVPGPPGRLEPNPCPPVRPCEEVRPIAVNSNSYVFDAMYSGWPRLKVSGAPGQKVVVEGSAKYEFVLKGAGEEVLEPQFMVQTIGPKLTVKGVSSPLKEVTIKWAHADLRKTAEFECSSAFLNRVYAAFVRTHLSYTYDFPMDPTREKTGWTQDAQTMFDSAAFATDMQAVYRRWWQDFRDNQTPDGAVGSVAPMVWGGQDDIWNDPWWGGMVVYTPWKLYQHYGDQQVLEEAYEAMRTYLAWLGTKAGPDGLIHWAGASDWIEVGIDGWGPPKRTPTFLVSTCAWYLYADILRQTAEVLGKPEEARRHGELARRIKDVFNTRCFDPSTGFYAGATNSQTALILPLCLGLVPEVKRALVLQRLEENIHRWKDHLSTGFVGTPYLLEGLPDLGLAELSYRIVTQPDYAGWNTLITDGVMKETWRGGMAQMPSLGGSIGQWFYRTLAGIRPDAPGFKRIIIKPSLVGDLTWVKAWYDSPYGRIASHWQRKNGARVLEVTIPPNTTATIYVPAQDVKSVTESGQPAATAAGVQFLRMEDSAVVFNVGSGSYRFVGE